MKTTILLVLVVSGSVCASCSSSHRHQHVAASRQSRTILTEATVREIALVRAKMERKNADQFMIEKVDAVIVKGRIRWVVMFSMKEDQIVDSDFWVDVDDQTGRAFVRGHFSINPDDIREALVSAKEEAEPGATDNPDGAQRLREDH